MNRIVQELCQLLGGHRWRYAGTGRFTGYIERCERCDAIRQIPQ